jgi:hypothetical protein
MILIYVTPLSRRTNEIVSAVALRVPEDDKDPSKAPVVDDSASSGNPRDLINKRHSYISKQHILMYTCRAAMFYSQTGVMGHSVSISVFPSLFGEHSKTGKTRFSV